MAGKFEQIMADVAKGRGFRIIQAIGDVLFGDDSHSANRYEDKPVDVMQEVTKLEESIGLLKGSYASMFANYQAENARANRFEEMYLNLLEKYDPGAYERYGEDE